MFQNECRYRFATFAAFDLPKSTIKIAYPERKRMEKKRRWSRLKCSPLEGFITRRKVAETSSQLFTTAAHVFRACNVTTCFWNLTPCKFVNFWKCARGTIVSIVELKTVGKFFWLVFRLFPYERLNIELIISMYFDSRKPSSSCVGYSNQDMALDSILYLDQLYREFVWTWLCSLGSGSICLLKPGIFME